MASAHLLPPREPTSLTAHIPISRYGLGNIYFRQEKFDFAEHHLRKALAINPCSSPLYCYLGMALHANSKPTQARDNT